MLFPRWWTPYNLCHEVLPAAKRALLITATKVLNTLTRLAAAYPHAVVGVAMALLVMAIAAAVAGLAELAYVLVGWATGAR